MKIVKVKGGLGNQLFQYSFALLLQKITNDIVKLDLTSFNFSQSDSIRKPRLLKFQIPLQIATNEEIKQFCILNHSDRMTTNKYRLKIIFEAIFNKKYYFEKSREYTNPSLISNYSYYDGYWQSWENVQLVWDDLSPLLIPQTPLNEETNAMIQKVKTEDSVFIGIRRGDYLKYASHYGNIGNKYYQNSINYMCKKIPTPKFYIFSNDIEWVKSNMSFNQKVTYFDNKNGIDDFEELFIMASCKHAIIPNSTFHWWGARMISNPEKIVICPEQWFADNKKIDNIPPSWIRIPV